MVITGNVLNVQTEKRDLVGKDGSKRSSQVLHVLMMSGKMGTPDVEINNIRSFDPTFDIPKIGDTWTTPKVKKFENFNGNVCEVLI